MVESTTLCGINKVLSMHSFRHTFATYMLTVGVSMESVAQMLGHKDLRSTRIYGRILKERVNSEMAEVKEKRKNAHNQLGSVAS